MVKTNLYLLSWLLVPGDHGSNPGRGESFPFSFEVWKSINVTNYPIQLEKNKKSALDNERILRPGSSMVWKEDARKKIAKESFSRNAAKVWNQAPVTVKNATTLGLAKSAIKLHCLTLPI